MFVSDSVVERLWLDEQLIVDEKLNVDVDDTERLKDEVGDRLCVFDENERDSVRLSEFEKVVLNDSDRENVIESVAEKVLLILGLSVNVGVVVIEKELDGEVEKDKLCDFVADGVRDIDVLLLEVTSTEVDADADNDGDGDNDMDGVTLLRLADVEKVQDGVFELEWDEDKLNDELQLALNENVALYDRLAVADNEFD